jgi:hypothetical protein
MSRLRCESCGLGYSRTAIERGELPERTMREDLTATMEMLAERKVNSFMSVRAE